MGKSGTNILSLRGDKKQLGVLAVMEDIKGDVMEEKEEEGGGPNIQRPHFPNGINCH